MLAAPVELNCLPISRIASRPLKVLVLVKILLPNRSISSFIYAERVVAGNIVNCLEEGAVRFYLKGVIYKVELLNE